LNRVVRDINGNGVKYLAAHYSPDLFKLERTLSCVGAGDARHWEPVVQPVKTAAAEREQRSHCLVILDGA
jgi:GntR family transcriptional regulator